MDKKGQKGTSRKDLAILYNVSEKTITRWKKTGHLQKIIAEKKAEDMAKEIVVSLKSDVEYKAEIRTRGLQVIEKTIRELLEANIDYKDIENLELLKARLKLIEVLGKL